MIRFEWDDDKALKNLNKHKVSFDEAMSVFDDSEGLIILDEDNSKDEERFVLMGLSEILRILVIVHCYREDDEVIRIISARKANKKETKQYQRKNYEK